MPATPARIALVTQEFRTVKDGPTTAVDTKYGAAARKTEEPIETFFEVEADAQSMCTERRTLLGRDARRFVQTVQGEATGMGLSYSTTSPVATVIDDERLANHTAAISEITIDFDKEKTKLETWG